MAVAVLAVGAVSAVLITRGDANDDRSTTTATTRKTAIAQRKDMVRSATYDGTTQVREVGQLRAARPGTITWLPDEGTVVKPAEVLYRIDEQPTYLMTGEIPMYRDLDMGVVDGRDIQQVESNLIAWGYGGSALTEPDVHFDATTRAAIRAWQTATGQTVTGRLNRSDVVFASAAVVIGDRQANVGDSVGPAAPVAKLIDQNVEVMVSAKASDRDELAVGRSVTVGSETPPRLAVVRSQDTDAGGIRVALDLKDPWPFTRAGESFKVKVELERHDKVVAVPVNALVALAEGGYAVEVVDGATTHLVSVTVGLFADGAVEINGVDSGTTVVVPA